MPKIRNWSKQFTPGMNGVIWRNDDNKRVTVRVTKAKSGRTGRVSWNVRLSDPRTNKAKIRKGTYDTKEKAMNVARQWMKNHPKWGDLKRKEVPRN